MDVEDVCKRTIDLLEDLRIQEATHAWIDRVFIGNFCEIEGPPDFLSGDFQRTKCFSETLTELTEVAEKWVALNELKPFWALLPQHGMLNKALVAVLASFITLKRKGVKATWADISSILASRTYLSLVLVPGSGAHGILNQVLLMKSIENLKRWPSDTATKRKRPTQNDQRGAKSRRGNDGRHRRRMQEEDSIDDETMHDGMEGDGVIDDVSSEMIGKAMKQYILAFLKDFIAFMHKVSLKDLQQVLYSSIQILSHLARLECPHDNFRHNGKCIRPLAYEGVEVICTEFHGDVVKLSRCVMNFCLTSVLMLHDDKPVTSATIPRNLQSIKNDAIDFVCDLTKKSPVIAVAVRVLLQNICVKCPERAEYRNILSLDICKIIRILPENIREVVINWIKKYSRNTKIGYRTFSVDIISKYLINENAVDGNQELQTDGISCNVTLLQAVVIRCSDRSPTVRAKALSCLHQVACSTQQNVVAAVKESLSNSISRSGLFQSQNITRGANPDSRSAERSTLLDLVRRRIKDDKVHVRKAAIQALESLLRLVEDGLDAEDISLIHERCMDPSLSVRKQAVQSLTQLLEYAPANALLQKLWLNGVLPMVSDRETTAQEKCVSLLDDLILSNIVPFDRTTGPEQILAWNLLEAIAGSEGQELSQYFDIVCENWGKQGKFSAKLAKNLQTHLETRNSKAAWLFISAISSSCDKIDSKIISEYWFENIKDSACSDVVTMSRILKTINTISNNLAQEIATRLLDDIQLRIFRFRCPPELIALCVQCLSKLFARAPGGDGKLREWCESVLTICEEDISKSVLGTEHAIPIDKIEIAKRLVTLGEIAQLCPSKTNERMFMMVQSLLLPAPSEKGNNDESGAPIQNLVISSSTKAYAFTTLGKLCLQNEGLAKKCVALLARELEISKDAAIKNNIIVVLCDLCVRYTNLVDRYIPNIAACLADPEPIVRRQAITLLTHLLQEDFVKWKGSLFFRFITALVDEDADIKQFAEFCLVHILLPRHPAMFSHHFVETLFCFNSYTKHRAYNQFKQSETERKRFSLAGDKNKGKRMQIYTFLLRNMNDEQRFKLTGKLCEEIFGPILDDSFLVDAHSRPLIEDAFALISCQEIKISSAKSKLTDPDVDEMMEEQQEAAVRLRAKVISAIVKKNMIENIFPTIISLKKRFEQQKSPLLRDLMRSLKEIMTDYKAEVQEVLGADKQLANEIAFDLRKYEERQREAAMVATAQPMTPVRNQQPHAQSSEGRPQLGPRTPLATIQSPHPMVSPRVNSAITPRNGSQFTSPKLKTPTNANVTIVADRVSQSVPVNVRPPTSAATHKNLAATALLNSAKKVMVRMQRLSISKQVPTTPGNVEIPREMSKTTLPLCRQPPKPVMATENGGSPCATEEVQTTPVQSQRVASRTLVPKETDQESIDYRAISTPQGNLSHISFLAPADISMIPIAQSPVPVKITRLTRKQGRIPPSRNGAEHVICMPSPDKPSAKPHQWNVQSPARWNKR